MSANQTHLCICEDIFKGIPFNYWWPIQVRDLTCFRHCLSINVDSTGQVIKSLTPQPLIFLGGALAFSWWCLSGKDCKIAWCSTSRALSLCSSFLVHPPTVMPGAACVKEQPLVPCGHALLQ